MHILSLLTRVFMAMFQIFALASLNRQLKDVEVELARETRLSQMLTIHPERRLRACQRTHELTISARKLEKELDAIVG